MNQPATIPHRPPYPTAPDKFAQLHLNDDAWDDDCGWDESEDLYECDSLAGNMLEFLSGLSAG